jgi:hypothetical protein
MTSIPSAFFVCMVSSALQHVCVAQVVLRSLPQQGINDDVVMLGDINGDGVRDIAIAHHNSSFSTGVGTVEIFSTVTGAVLLQIPGSVTNQTKNVFVTGDHDGDGRADIGIYEWRPSGSIVTTHAVVRSGITGAYIMQYPGAGSPPVGGIDANADGVPDLVLSNGSYSVGSLLYVGRVDVVDGVTLQVIRTHIGTFAHEQLSAASRCRAGDIDGDGYDDYVLGFGPMAPNPAYRFYSAATGALLATVPKLSATYGLGIAGCGDFNADGYGDICLRDQGNPPLFGYFGVHVLAGPNLGQFPPAWFLVASPPAPVGYTDGTGRIGDIDGDGHDDLGLTGGTAGIATTILSGRNQTPIHQFPTPTVFRYLLAETEGPGDVNSDGFPDILLKQVNPPFFTTAVLQIISGAPPGVTLFGSGCADQTGKEPRIGLGVGARLGKTMTINLSNANPALLLATLALGFSNTIWSGTALPFDLGFIGMPGCTWYIQPEAALAVPTIGLNGTRHHASYEIPVPSQPGLLGLDVYSQWLLLEAGPAGLTGATTKAARATVVQ